MTTREHPDEETASELYARRATEAPWAPFCTSPDYCTRPCVECAKEGRLAAGETP